MSIKDEEMVNEIWVSDNLTSIIFTDKEMDDLMNSCLENGIPSPKMKKGFGYMKRKLRVSRTKSEIKTATPKQLDEWLQKR